MLQFLHPSRLGSFVVQARGTHLRLVGCGTFTFTFTFTSLRHVIHFRPRSSPLTTSHCLRCMGSYVSGGGGIIMPPEFSKEVALNVAAAFKRLALSYNAVKSSVKAAGSSDEDRKPNSMLQKPVHTTGPQPGTSAAAAAIGDDDTATISPAGPAMQRDIALCSAFVLDLPLSVHLTGWPDHQTSSAQQQRDAALEVAVPALVLEALGVAIGDLIQVVTLVCHASSAISLLHKNLPSLLDNLHDSISDMQTCSCRCMLRARPLLIDEVFTRCRNFW